MINGMNVSYFGPVVSAIKYFMMHYNRGVPASQQGVYDLVLEHDGFINVCWTHKYKDRYGLLQLLSNLGIVRKMTAVIWREFSQLDFFYLSILEPDR